MNYVFSRNIDDGSVTVTQGGDNDLPQDPDSRKAERGLSNYDVRHYFVALLDLGPAAAAGARNGWASGWQWNAITSLASGNPFSVVVGFDRARARFQAGTSPQRPDLVAGQRPTPSWVVPTATSIRRPSRCRRRDSTATWDATR